ncbi:thiamine biosynthesis protein ThiP [Bdellovibrio bacteriovorus]|uniref:Thiamine biosynthesis protein ThiP n=2 Tax=Bdellovibrio bacteriovorus TaxID=959 RepID=A0A150WRZ4_BDEBC|nr:thiamine biosynthesis protein ThiP [Bdellovibrio bacteriovorus]
MNLRSLLRLSLVLFLLFPFLFLFSQFQISQMPNAEELRWAFKNSFTQSFFSALFSLIFGLWAALGLVSLRHGSWRKAAEILCLIPNFLPPLFSLLAILNAVDFFPMGLAGIIFVHTAINFGLVAVLLARTLESRIGHVIELAYVEGASRHMIWFQVLIPMLRKELLYLGLFVFIICFGSFSVPLIVGGGMGTTVEVLIYEKIRLSAEWGEAIVLAFLQSLFIFAVSFIVGKGAVPPASREASLKAVAMPSGVVFLALCGLFYFYGYGQGVLNGLMKFERFAGMGPDILKAFGGSVFLGMTAGIFSYVALMLIAYCWPKWWFEKFLAGYVAPSTSLACFSFLILTPNEGFYPYIKIPIALVLLSLNGLFRMGWDSSLHALEQQIRVAYTMGASHAMIFKEILFPQISEKAGVLAGIAAVWTCGDFAVSRILAHKEVSIAMMTDSLMSGYRLDQATAVSVLIILAGAVCYCACKGGSYVLRRKFEA